MRDMLDTGATWLTGKRAGFMAHTVTYARGEDEVDVAATVGRTLYRAVDEYGVEIIMAVRDYLVTTAALILDAVVSLPVAGDRIEDGDYTYEVMSPGAGQPCWRYSDLQRGTLRVHTKEVEKP